MLVSVIIPCYKQGRFLEECVGSIFAQTYQNWEVLIINDGSPDDTEIVAKNLCRIDQRIKFISKKNGGLSSARNLGLQAATGQAVQFLDADDLLESRKLEFQVDYLKKNSDIDVVYGQNFYFDHEDQLRAPYLNAFLEGSRDRDWIEERSAGIENPLRALFQHNIFPVCTPLVRMSAIRNLAHEKYFSEDLEALEDWHFWTRLAATKAKFAFQKRRCGASLVRVHAHSMTNDRHRMHTALIALQQFQIDLAYELSDRVHILSSLSRSMSSMSGDDFMIQYERLIKKRLLKNERIALSLGNTHRKFRLFDHFFEVLYKMLPWRITAIAKEMVRKP